MKRETWYKLFSILFLLVIGFFLVNDRDLEAVREIRIVAETDTAGANILDKWVRAGDTFTLELWIETDTNINGVAAYLLYEANKLNLIGTGFTKDTTIFGDTALLDTGFDYGGSSDTMIYAILTTADSLAMNSSARVCTLTLAATFNEDTGIIGFNLDYTNNKASMIASIYATDVLNSLDSGVIRIDATPPKDTFILISPIDGETRVQGSIQFVWQTTYDTGSGLSHWVLEYDTDLTDSFNPSLYRVYTSDSVCTYTPAINFTIGTWVWRAAAVDEVGNTSSWSLPETFVVILPTTPQVYIDSPTGYVPTNDTPFYVAGSTLNTQAGDTVRIRVNGIIQDTKILSIANDTFAFDTVSLSPGYDTIIVELIDSQGVVIDSDYVVVEYNDSVYVIIQIPVPSGFSYDTNYCTVTISGTAGDVENGDSIYLYRNNIIQNTYSLTGNSWSGTVTLSGLGDSIVVKVKDRFGNIDYDTITINYDTLASIEILSPINPDTRIDTVIISGTVADVLPGDTVWLYVNGVLTDSKVLTDTTWSCTAYLKGMGDSVVAKLTDRYGNIAWDTITLNLDTTPPTTVTLLSPPDATETRFTAITFIWVTSIDTQSGLFEHRLQVDTLGTFAYFIYDSSAGTGTSGILTLAANDTFYWRVLAIDDAGNTSVSNTRTILIDTIIPPKPTIISPANNTETRAQPVYFDWTDIIDTTSGLNRYHIQIEISGVVVVDSDVTTSDTSITLNEETYYWRVVAIDDAGNTSGYTDSSLVIIDRTAPVIWVVLIETSDSRYFTDSGGIDTTLLSDTVYFNNTGAGDGQRDTVQLTVSGADTVIFEEHFGDTTFYDTQTPYLYAYTIEIGYADTMMIIIARDNAGNEDSVTICWIRDITPPPPVSLVTPLDGQITGDTTPSFTWNQTTDTQSGTKVYLIEIATDNLFTNNIETSFIYTTSYTSSGLDSGTYYWRVIAYDTVSNYDTLSCETRTLRIDTSFPYITAITIISSVPSYFYDDTPIQPSILGDTVYFNPTYLGANQMNTITVYVYDDNEDTVTGSSAFIVIAGIDTGLNEDSYTLVYQIPQDTISQSITIVALDLLGYSDTVVVFFVKDTSPPLEPQRISPSSGVETNAVNITFSWTTSSDTGAGLSRYRLQIDTAGTFVNNLVDSYNGLLTSTSVLLPPNDTYYWRVIAIDLVSNTGAMLTDSVIIDTSFPDTPRLLLPILGYETNVVAITFRWDTACDSVSGLSGYRIQIDTSNTFASLKIDTYLGNRTDTTLSLIPNDTYYWRIIAIDDVGNTSVSSDSYLIIDTLSPTVPSLVSPASSLCTNAIAVTFDWDTSYDTGSGLSYYKIQIDTSGNFTTLIFDTQIITRTDTTLSLQPNDTYYWRIIAFDDVGNTSSSQTRFIIIDTQPPTTVTLLNPPDPTETTQTTINFTWTASADTISGLAGYYLQIDSSGNFISPDTSIFTISTTGTYTFTVYDTYYWRVLSIDTASNISISSTSTLIISVPDTAPPETPVLISPIGSTETNVIPVLFIWSDTAASEPDFDHYTIQIDTASNFINLVFSGDTNNSETSYILVYSDTYYWRVIAYDSSNNASTSTIGVFIFDRTAPNIPQLFSPSNGANTTTLVITFDWNDVYDTHSGLKNYVLYIDNDSGFAVPDFVDTETQSGTTITFGTADTYYWKVYAYDDLNNTSVSAVYSFAITTVDTQAPTAFTLTSPANGIETRILTITFSWQNSFDDTSPPVTYRLQIDTEPTFTDLLVDTYWLTETYTTYNFTGSDTLYWRVIARDNVGNTTVSTETRYLIVDTLAPAIPQLFSPINNAGTSVFIITFDWSDVSDSHSGFAFYVLYVDNDSTFASPTFVGTGTISGTTVSFGTSDTYYWKVYAYDDLNNTSVSIVETFSITITDTTPPSAFSLLIPSNGYITKNPLVVFTWWPSTDDTSPPVSYRVQIDTENTFNGLLLDTYWLSANNLNYTFSSSDTLYWRVIAKDNVGNTTPSNETWYLIVDITKPDKPALITPTAGENTSTLQIKFDWQDCIDSHTGVGTYVIYIDTSQSFSNTYKIIDTITISETTVTLTYADTYYWVVFAIDKVGNISDTSNTESVVILGGVNSFLVYAPSVVTVGSNFNITITAKDVLGSVMTNYSGTVNLIITAGTISPQTLTGFVNGIKTAAVSINTTGTTVLTVNDSVNNDAYGTVLILVKADTVSRYIVDAPSQVSRGIGFNLTITAIDQFGNVVDYYTGTVALSADASFTPETTPCFVNGVITLSVTFTQTGAGITITANDGTHTGTDYITIINGIDRYVISAPSTVSSGQSFTIDIIARDALNNVVSGFNDTVSFFVSSGIVSPAFSDSFTNGILMNQNMQITGIGNITLTATDNTAYGTALIAVASVLSIGSVQSVDLSFNDLGNTLAVELRLIDSNGDTMIVFPFPVALIVPSQDPISGKTITDTYYTQFTATGTASAQIPDLGFPFEITVLLDTVNAFRNTTLDSGSRTLNQTDYTSVIIPQGSLGATNVNNAKIIIKTEPDTTIQNDISAINQLINTNSQLKLIDSALRNFTILVNNVEYSIFDNYITIRLPWSDTNPEDGYVDNEQYVHESTLRVYHFNENSKLWDLVPDATFDYDVNVATVRVKEFSSYILMGIPGLNNISAVTSYPNPFRPRQTPKVVIDTFTRNHTYLFVRIYTVTGDLVRVIQGNDVDCANGVAYWDGLNGNRKEVAPGLYIYVVESSFGKAVGKMTVIR
ncbi:MAG: hypothetical protein AB1765_00625 [Candidatus Hydrogenedentota bacterium]